MSDQKYVILAGNVPVVFPVHVDHSTFASLSPTSAGFVNVKEGNVEVFGGSLVLSLFSKKGDKDLLQTLINGLERGK